MSIVCNAQPVVADAKELEAFVDGVWEQQKQSDVLAGMTISVVQDGQVLLSKGYGYADVEQRLPVDAARSLFRIGSVSKTFVWIAVMQLAERGLVTLDADVNDYLKSVEIPAAFDGPVTLRDIMSHTAGFDEQVVGLFSKDSTSVVPLAERLAFEMPPRVRPPGNTPSYSNHATALAALIVEDVTGEPFAEYLQRHLFAPLGLHAISIAQPVPDSVAGKAALGYRLVDGALKPQPFEVVPLAPIGAIAAAADAMAVYMRELLWPTEKLLKTETMLRMREPLLREHPQLTAALHGFYEHSVQPRSYGHGGDTLWFHSEMRLFPDHGLGVFVSYNSDSGAPARSQLMNALVAHYFARPPLDLKPVDGDALREFTGTFGSTRVSEHTLARLVAVLSQIPVHLQDGYLAIPSPDGTRRFAQIGKDLFAELNGRALIAFARDDSGQVQRLLIEGVPVQTMQRVPWYAQTAVQLGVVLGCAAMLLLTMVRVPWIAWRRRPAWRGDALASGSAWATSAMLLVSLLLIAAAFADPNAIVFGELDNVRAVLWLPLIALVPLALAAVLVARGVWQGRWDGRRRWLLMLSVVAGIVLTVWLNHWQLLGFHYPTPG